MTIQIKTISDRSIMHFDAIVNEFMRTHRVKFTQTHTSTVSNIGGDSILYTAVIYYEDIQ